MMKKQDKSDPDESSNKLSSFVKFLISKGARAHYTQKDIKDVEIYGISKNQKIRSISQPIMESIHKKYFKIFNDLLEIEEVDICWFNDSLKTPLDLVENIIKNLEKKT